MSRKPGKKIIKKMDFDTRANLFRAAKNGDFRLIAWLRGYGVDLDQRDAHGNSAMHLAVQGGHLTTVDELLNAGAETAFINNKGETVLHRPPINWQHAFRKGSENEGQFLSLAQYTV